MTLSQPTDKSINAEFDRLTYSAYTLTLDPGLALSVVMIAIDDFLDELAGNTNRRERTVELSLQQLRRETTSRWNRESSATEVVLYGLHNSWLKPHSARERRRRQQCNSVAQFRFAESLSFTSHSWLCHQRSGRDGADE